MAKHDERKSAGNCPKITLNWPDFYFEAETRAEAGERRRVPGPRRTLRPGDRVSFDVGEGVEGPPYATHVRVLESK